MNGVEMFDVTKLKTYPRGTTVDDLKKNRPVNQNRQLLIEKIKQRLIEVLKSKI